MERIEHHGCGHFWCNVDYRYDTYTERAGFWWFIPDWRQHAR